MKLYLEPVQVEPTEGRPNQITWRGILYRIEKIIDYWIYQGQWWEVEERRLYIRVLTDRGVLELCQLNGQWLLSRMFD